MPWDNKPHKAFEFDEPVERHKANLRVYGETYLLEAEQQTRLLNDQLCQHDSATARSKCQQRIMDLRRFLP